VVCVECCIDQHAENPLHWMECWNGKSFDRYSLKSLALHVQLCHPMWECYCEACLMNCMFVVLHTNGIHEVVVNICDCENVDEAGLPDIQMLHTRWFLVTNNKPRTCATMAVLNQFLMSMLRPKQS
ncbi:hypothetical protein B0H10DRAFT_1717023, partial [Mycena sp. CBHHK59/15]